MHEQGINHVINCFAVRLHPSAPAANANNLSIPHDAIIMSSHMFTDKSLTTVPPILCLILPNEVYRTQATIHVSSRGGVAAVYSPPHPYVRTHPDLARLYDTDRSMERTHSGDIPKAPTSIGIQHQPRDVPIARYSTPAERCSYEASTSTDVP